MKNEVFTICSVRSKNVNKNKQFLSKTKKGILSFVIAIIMISLLNIEAFSHCEVPCGIYEDSVRIVMIKEHITTIEKSMIEIKKLSRMENINYNQLVRWINNKEEHANKLQEIVEQYFLTQRIKPVDEKDEKYSKYIKQITLLHKMLIYAMKTKQTTDQEYIQKLKATVASFETAYFHKH